MDEETQTKPCPNTKAFAVIMGASHSVPDVLDILQAGLTTATLREVASVIEDVTSSNDPDVIREHLRINPALRAVLIDRIKNVPFIPEPDTELTPEELADEVSVPSATPVTASPKPVTLGSLSEGFTKTHGRMAVFLLILSYITMFTLMALLLIAKVDGSTAVGGALIAILVQQSSNIATAFNFVYGGSASSEASMLSNHYGRGEK